nr:hypothetical protein [Microbacterium sp. MF43]
MAATSHTLAGGGAPAPLLVAVMATLAWPFATALIGRRLSVSRIGAAVVVGQLLFHAAFAVTAGADPASATGHLHHAALAGTAGTGLAVPAAPMLVAHALAALVTVLGLYGGERMLRALGRGIRSILRRPALATPLLRTRLPRTATGVVAVAAHAVVLSDLSRRGPPAIVDAVA